LSVNPNNPVGGVTNSELYVNDGLPGDVRTTGGITRTYPPPPLVSTNIAPQTVGVEFLYVVNGQDDDNDGYIDNGFDGLNNDFQNGNDDAVFASGVNAAGTPVSRYGEWENEQWLGSLSAYNDPTKLVFNRSYVITRRPVPSAAARDIPLPASVVIDATTWNSTLERSRLPIDPASYTADVMLDQNGQVVWTSAYSSPSSLPMTGAFLHFWVSDRQDVYNPGAAVGTAATGTFPTLPLPTGFTPPNGSGWLNNFPKVTLAKDRMLLTLFSRGGNIVANSLETSTNPNNQNGINPAFSYTDPNAPFFDAQLGIREAK
jgi:hypothetical protein